ncbi:serine-rich adhesin for platelets-like isoform X2 [Macrobrachium nipponense]
MNNIRGLFTLLGLNLLLILTVVAVEGNDVKVKMQRNTTQCNSMADYPSLKTYLDGIVSGQQRPFRSLGLCSEVICSMTALRRRSVAYAYRNGSCLLIGEGTSLDCRSASYELVDQELLDTQTLEIAFEASNSNNAAEETTVDAVASVAAPTTSAADTLTGSTAAPSTVTGSTTIASSTLTTTTTLASSTVTESTTSASSTVTESTTTSPSIVTSTTPITSTVTESTTTVPSTATESSTTVPSTVKASSTTVPSIVTESSTTVPSTVTESSTTVPSTATESTTTAVTTTKEATTTTISSLDLTVEGCVEAAGSGTVYATDHKKTLSTSYPKELAIDRNNKTSYISNLLILSKPWWLVDLKAVRRVVKVYILPFAECGLLCVKASHIMFYIGSTLVTNGNFNSYNNIANYWGIYTSNLGYILAPFNSDGQYVAIVLNGEIGVDALTLAEVLVFVES